MKSILVLAAAATAMLLGGCAVAPDHGGYRDGYYHGDGDRDHWQGGPRYCANTCRPQSPTCKFPAAVPTS